VGTLPTEAAGLMDSDFINGAGSKIDFGCGKLSFSDVGKAPRENSDSDTEREALTVFVQGKEGHSPQPCLREMRKHVQFSVSFHREPTINQSRTWLVKDKENIIIAPRCRQIVAGILESGNGQSTPALVCVEPAQIPVEGIFPARALSRSERDERAVLAQANSNATGNLGSSICVMLDNFSDEELTVPKATILGVAEEISESLVDKINPEVK
jgi:hypothetical protein